MLLKRYTLPFAALLYMLCFCSCNSDKQGPGTPEQLFEKYHSAVVLIRNQFYYKMTLKNGLVIYGCEPDEDGFIGSTLDKNEALSHMLGADGTGFFISEDGKIATNRHVVSPHPEDMDDDDIYTFLARELGYLLEGTQTDLAAYQDSLAIINQQFAENPSDENDAKRRAITDSILSKTKQISLFDTDMDDARLETIAELTVAFDGANPSDPSSFKPCRIITKASDANIDLAIIQLESEKTPDEVKHIFSFNDQDPNEKGPADSNRYDPDKPLRIDQKLFMIGYNYGEEMAKTSQGIKVQFTQGTVSQQSDDYKVLYSIPSLPGSSGSPVIDQWGNLMAINFAGVRNSQSFNYGILAKHLRDLTGVNTFAAKAKKEDDENSSTANSSNDKSDVIRQYILAEDSRDFDRIWSFYAPHPQQYWDLNNPSEASVRKRFEHNWSVMSSSANEVTSIRQVNADTYDVGLRFSFTTQKGTSRTVDAAVRFVFDADGKITKCYKRP